MYTTTLLTSALLAGAASAKSCLNFTVPVTISARTGVFGNSATIETNLDPTTFAQNTTQQGRNYSAVALTGYQTTSGTYNISAQYCVPSFNSSSKPNTIQILTHGIGFDKTYFDAAYDNFNYSYVDNALSHGYATLAYDRLSIGNSTHAPNSTAARDEFQSFLEIQALRSLTTMIRNGSMPHVNQTYSKVVHVGHSFGSAQTYALVAQYPNLSDGIVLTGFSMNASFVGYFAAGADFQLANLNQPFRFGSPAAAGAIASGLNFLTQAYALTDYVAGLDLASISAQSLDYPNGYIVNSNANSQQYLFFHPGMFDTGILYWAESTKQPVTQGELFTLGSLPMMNAYKGPVLVMTGENDLPYCGGNCLATGGAAASVPAGVKMNFPNASSFEAYIQPNTGHGLNFHYNATAGYDVIANWLSSHKLKA